MVHSVRQDLSVRSIIPISTVILGKRFSAMGHVLTKQEMEIAVSVGMTILVRAIPIVTLESAAMKAQVSAQ